MPAKTHTDAPSFLPKLLGLAERKKASPLFKTFLAKFYAQVDDEGASDTALYAKAENAWKCFSNRKPGQARNIRVSTVSETREKAKLERSVLEVLSHDMPFILDSLISELNRQGHRVLNVIHPILYVKRNTKGDVTDIAPENGKKEFVAESFIRIELAYVGDKTAEQKLSEGVDKVLNAVNLAVQDWQSMRSEMEETTRLLPRSVPGLSSEGLKEVRDFMDWVYRDNFIFLGYREVSAKGEITNALGVAKLDTGISYPDTGKSSAHPLVRITKTLQKSVIHRPVPMDCLSFTVQGSTRQFVGLFTSTVYFQSARLIPIIRQKMDEVIARANFIPKSYNAKSLVTALETFPRDELLQTDVDNLYEICVGLVALEKTPKVRLFLREDASSRFYSCLVYVPRERYNTRSREQIQKILEAGLGGTMTDYYAQITDSPLARLHVIVRADSDAGLAAVNAEALERKIEEVTSSWGEGLSERLSQLLGEKEGERLFHLYRDAFPASYISRYHFSGTVKDILKMEHSLTEGDIGFDLALDLYKLQIDTDDNFQLKIFHPERQITLSEILPTLEFMGFKVLDSLTFQITPIHRKTGLWAHHFRLALVKVNEGVPFTMPSLESVKSEFEAALSAIWHNRMENDPLNSLIIRAGMNMRDITLLRAYGKYLRQAAFPFSPHDMYKTLSRHPYFAVALVNLFHARFGIEKIAAAAREEKLNLLIRGIENDLANVSSVTDDRIIRRFMDVMGATLRTNFYLDKPYLSFKLDSAKVPQLPLPRPYAEIFVYGYEVEGIHLRGGKVARGGLRWSDRKDDFRTEVLGLMKAQMVKNAVIVPVGSKGGFVVKHPVKNGTRDQILAQGIECYKTYLRGLLDVTDNIVNGKITPPKNVTRHDNDDPYLVVAADKGTATFSDIANSVSAEYNFWLSDAFASGGSAGYDHKGMAITAKGAWVSVERHFREMGKDIDKETFTAVGVGDMAGDVFGNGMLRSKNIRLIAAFNHMHIFLDPDPDAAKTFKERERLFNLPRSSWTDYNAKLISAGGGLFERKAKSIKLTKEIKKALDIKADSLSPDDLIKAILRAPVDLLWNGGIGTYVKSSEESNDVVGDRANDSLRVNGEELRCKVIGEGGNLGFTQRGRVEFALAGGRINTDAIDNSGGVDCSDHEVNIKIGLDIPLKSGKLKLAARNTLLADMTAEVESLVLRDNVLQTLALSIEQSKGSRSLDAMEHLMKKLEREGLLSRAIEYLPDSEDIGRRYAEKLGLTRPELAVMLAYSKISIYNTLIKTNLPDDPYFHDDLMIYFPPAMVKKYQKEITEHPLKREIIATFATNSMVNRMGITFFHQIMEDTGQNAADITRAYAVARDAFGLRALWAEIEAMDGKVPASSQFELFLEITALVERVTLWFLRNVPQPINVAEVVKYFKPGVEELASYLDAVLAPAARKTYERKLERFLSLSIPESTARKFAVLETLSSACEILHIQKACAEKKISVPLKVISEGYYALGNRLSIGFLRFCARRLPADSYWQRLAQRNFIDGFYDQQMRLTLDMIKSAPGKKITADEALSHWLEVNAVKLSAHDSFITEMRGYEMVDAAMLLVASRRVESLLPV